MNNQMPPVAQFSLPSVKPQGQQSPQTPQAPQGNSSPSDMPPVATFSLPSNLSQSQQSPKDAGVIGNLAQGNFVKAAGSAYNDIASPLVGIAATPLQAGVAGFNKLTGSNVQDPFAQGMPGIGSMLGAGNMSVSPLDAEKKLGNIAQVGSFLVPGEGILAAGAAGALQGAGGAMSQGGSAKDVATQGAVGGVAGGLIGGAGKLLEPVGSSILNRIIKPSLADIKDGFSMATVNENNLGGTLTQMGQKTDNLLTRLYKQVTDKLANSKKTIDLAGVYDQTEKALTSEKGNIANLGKNAGIRRALANLQSEVLTANPTGALSVPDAQLAKQAAGEMGAWQFQSPDPDASSIEKVYNTFYHNLKVAIEDAAPEVHDLNAKISDLIPVRNAVVRRAAVSARNNGIGLNDMLGMLGMLSGGVKGFVPEAINKASQSGLVGKVLSQYAQKGARALAPVGATAANAVIKGLLSSGQSSQ